KILFASSEAAPFAKTGGLADVAGSLPPALAELGHDVIVVMPRYRQVDVETYKLKPVASLSIPLGTWQERCDVLRGRMGRNVTVYFIRKDSYYDRPGLYGAGGTDYPDNAERFIFFSRAIPELCVALNLRPDIVHCNDWQTGLVPLYLKKMYHAHASLSRAKSVFTVHNLGYQGLFWHWDMKLTGLGWDVFTPEGLEFWGRMNLLKAGLVYADSITTVSRTYSREIQTPEFGYGLEGVLVRRAADLYGILNGIDYAEWNPVRGRSLPRSCSPAGLAGKAVCRKKILKSLGLPDAGLPLIGMVTRLVDQKGLDIVTEALPGILSLGVQFVILGTGEEAYERLLADAAIRHHDRMRVLLQYNEETAKNIYAGCDLFLMPSQYEPCGLGQMIALRYGAVPVVRKTGGLADTVVDYDARTGRGTGFVFEEYSSQALLACVRRALRVFDDRKRWKRLLEAGMKQDFSWKNSAKEYVKVYRETMRKK
ncbi:MAG TPA: glycogen synthase GlgA, partial [Nitrospirota bacterium]|nr:glycogen synthase GlgA [Nitrospirota bacterium]